MFEDKVDTEYLLGLVYEIERQILFRAFLYFSDDILILSLTLKNKRWKTFEFEDKVDIEYLLGLVYEIERQILFEVFLYFLDDILILSLALKNKSWNKSLGANGRPSGLPGDLGADVFRESQRSWGEAEA